MAEYRTNSLFHYTSDIKTILNILETGALYPNYCMEVLKDEEPEFVLGIPEICFCDIPLTLANLFLDKYGKYAIAFSKQWGIEKGCNPVQYVCNGKIIEGAINRDKDLYDQITKLNLNVVLEGLIPNVIEYFKLSEERLANMYALGFMKQYYGDDYQEGYINYNENEWRYIIEYKKIKWYRSRDEYIEWRSQGNCNGQNGTVIKSNKKPEPTDSMKEAGLHFKPSDINHIIVYENNEIPSIVSKIKEIKKIGDYDLDDDARALLISKINSFERIKSDY